MKQIIWVVLGWLALLHMAHATSFECEKAKSKIEKVICGDAELSKLDENLNKVYLRSLERSDVKQQAIESQRQWLKNGRNVCQNAECIKAAYETRIKELGFTSSFGVVFSGPSGSQLNAPQTPVKLPGSQVAQPVKIPKAQVGQPQKPDKKQNSKPNKYLEACRAVANAANRKKLDELVVPFAELIQVDINNDGKQERVVLNSEGTMHWEHLEVFGEDGKPIALSKSNADDWNSDKLRWALDQSLIRHDEQIYILV